MQAQYVDDGQVMVQLDAGETLAHTTGPLTLTIVPREGLILWDALKAAGVAIAPAPAVAPDGSTLSDWRVGLMLWRRPDGTTRLDEVTAAVEALVSAGHPLGRVARERLEYANHVARAQLLGLKDLFGFSTAEVEESLWRADRVSQGDLTGVWPAPINQP